MASRQERRAAQRAAAKAASKSESQPIKIEWKCDSTQEALEFTPNTPVMAVPPAVPVYGGRTMKIVKAFLTTDACPYGTGLKCYDLGGLRALRLANGKMKWMLS